MKIIISILLLFLAITSMAQDQDAINRLQPYFDPKDKEILLNIDENTGELKGVISLQQPWVDKAFSKDGKFLYTVSANYVTKIDLDAFKIIEEKKFYEKPAKEEWDDNRSYLPDAYAMRYKVSSQGNVLFLKRSSRYSELAKDEFELTKKRDSECEGIKNKGGEWYEEWKRVFDSYNNKLKPIHEAKNKHMVSIEMMLFSFSSSETKSMGITDVGSSPNKINDFIFEIKGFAKDPADTLIIINMLTGDKVKKERGQYLKKTALDFEPSSWYVQDIGGLTLVATKKGKGEIFNGEYIIVPMSYNGVVDYSKKKYFSTFEEYQKYYQTQYLSSFNGKYFIDVDREYNLKPPVLKTPPSPREGSPEEFKKMGVKKQNEAMAVWQEEVKKATELFQVEYKEYLNKLQKQVYLIIDPSKEESILKIDDARLVYIYKGNKLLIDRKYELELYDLENEKTIWVTELDY